MKDLTKKRRKPRQNHCDRIWKTVHIDLETRPDPLLRITGKRADVIIFDEISNWKFSDANRIP